MSELGSILGIVGASVSAISLITAIWRTSKTETKELEHRLTSLEKDYKITQEDIESREGRLTRLEENQFKKEDRDCLKDLSFKMNLIWSTIQIEFPRLLKQQKTPLFDRLLDKVSEVGVKGLSTKEIDDLLSKTSEEYEKSLKKEVPARTLALALYKATLLYEKNHINKVCNDVVKDV